ncbi:DUF6132 family protein [Bacteroidota bacterium]
MEFIKKNMLIIALTVAGILGGFLYWKFIGCESGTCPLTSVWYNNAIFGGFIGFLTGDTIKDMVHKHKNK